MGHMSEDSSFLIACFLSSLFWKMFRFVFEEIGFILPINLIFIVIYNGKEKNPDATSSTKFKLKLANRSWKFQIINQNINYIINDKVKRKGED